MNEGELEAPRWEDPPLGGSDGSRVRLTDCRRYLLSAPIVCAHAGLWEKAYSQYPPILLQLMNDNPRFLCINMVDRAFS